MILATHVFLWFAAFILLTDMLDKKCNKVANTLTLLLVLILNLYVYANF